MIRKLLAVMALFFVLCSSSFANFYIETGGGYGVEALTASCADFAVISGMQALHVTPVTCSTDPIALGTVIYYGYEGYPFGPGTYTQYTDTVTYFEEFTPTPPEPPPVDFAELRDVVVAGIAVVLFGVGYMAGNAG